MILEQVENLYKIITLKELRRTKNVKIMMPRNIFYIRKMQS